MGRVIRRLTVFDGRLYPSYGDYGANTGPVDMVSLDLADVAAGWTSEITLQSEQTFMLRTLNDTLIAPFVDPQGGIGSPQNGQVARKPAGGSFSVLTNVTPVPVHVWDTAVTGDGWWLFGSSEVDGPTGTATIWRSTDDGATWTASLNVASGTPTWDESASAGARFYGVQQYADGTLIAGLLGAPDPESRVYRWAAGGSSWADITDADADKISDAAQVGFSYQGIEFFVAIFGGQAGHVSVRTADAVQQATIQALVPLGISDATATADFLYLLSGDSVRRIARDGTVTNLLTIGDALARSIAADEANGWLYYGRTDGMVGRVALP